MTPNTATDDNLESILVAMLCKVNANLVRKRCERSKGAREK